MAEVPKTTSLQYLSNISRKTGGMKLIFCMQISKPFYEMMLSILVSMASHDQSTQNNKLEKSLQYLKKMKLTFVLIDIKVFHKLVLSYLMGVTRHA